MQDKVRTFTESEELLEYLLINGCEIDLSKEDVEVLLGYETGRGYYLGEIAGKLCRVDVCMQPEVVEEITIDDVINEVMEWNYEMIKEADKDRHEPDDFVDFCNKQARYDSLAEDEKRIDAMFGQTSYLLSVKLDAPVLCRLDAPELDFACCASADCLHQHLQVI